ncbi:aminoacyl-tRNA hydrolase [Blattabacterium cuenoti]|uniref:aminoacyl-tRNA hydrolase n=1 Tax=Blattabacterium cuenoti TaxID=1653831 RepID=UPI00163CCC89|nr:aminoacyl-tRNA hydrolase [Blattabacterium cuenoti]
MKKFLIIGLGNPGANYYKTRHNIGFFILDKISKKYNVSFIERKLGFISKLEFDNKSIILLKPTTYMNHSGKSIFFWIKKENIYIKNILVISDDIYLKFGIIRLRKKGRSGGHNGLKSIEKEIKTSNYSRFKFGIGTENKNLKEVNYHNYVLNNWKKEELDILDSKSNKIIEIIFSFIINGLNNTINLIK